MSYILNKKLCPSGLTNNPNKNLKSIDFITIHNTGNFSPTAGAKNHADYQYNNSGGNKTSWHYTVDDKEVWQSFEDNQGCWHCGDGGNGIGNTTSIGIEICVNNQMLFLQACDNAAQLTADLLKKHNLTIDKVVQHNKWSGKDCPSELRSGRWGITWNQFLDLVKKYSISNVGDDEVVDQTKIKIDGKEYTVNRIIKDGRNYIELRSFEQAGYVVNYNETTKTPSIDSPKKASPIFR